MSSGIFEQIEDDQLLSNVLLSFCDFNSVVSVSRTCRRLKRCSDAALDNLAVVAASYLPEDYDVEYTIAEGCYFDDANETAINGELRRGWTEKFRSRASLIEEAMTHCHADDFGRVQYDEGMARFFFRSRGIVDLLDFLPDDADDADHNVIEAFGWKVKIKHYNITFAEALDMIMSGIMHIKAGSIDEEEKLDNTDSELLRLRHFVLCLLRKADTASFELSRLEVINRNTAGYGSCSDDRAVKFLLPDNKEFEFHFSYGYQVH